MSLRARLRVRDRRELGILLAALAIVVLAFAVAELADDVTEGDTQRFDERVLASLRDPADPRTPIGPRWLHGAALDITALGSATVLGLVVAGVCGFLLLQGLYRNALFIFVASCGAMALNAVLKAVFARPRPEIVPHLREVMTLSFPSGHALTSAATFLTLGALLMRVSQRRSSGLYCIGVAMLATALVGASRVYLGVHYPSDVLAGWMIGLIWALVCWAAERALERPAGLKEERAEAD